MRALQRSLRDRIARVGLADAAFCLYGIATKANPKSILGNARYRRDGAPDRLPIPSSKLIFLVSGTTDISWFLEAGSMGAATVRDALRRHGIELEGLDSILDFGCGCGRVLRYWRSLTETKVYGTDYNPWLVEWSRRNLPFGQFSVNQLEPPLAYESASFDLIYAFSVFTHLTEDLQIAWIRELTRVLKPGGHLLISTHGERYVDRLNESERQKFAAGQLVVKNNLNAPGTNTCSAYHPLSYIHDRLALDLEVLEFVPLGARGNPLQDLYVLRRP